MFYHVGGNQHIQNIQINKVTGENEKCVFYFMEKKTYGHLGQPNKTVAKGYEKDIGKRLDKKYIW